MIETIQHHASPAVEEIQRVPRANDARREADQHDTMSQVTFNVRRTDNTAREVSNANTEQEYRN